MAQGVVDWAEMRAQQRTFAEMIMHDDRDSTYVVAWISDGSWRQRAFRRDDLDFGIIPMGGSVYMSRNGFTGSRRDASHCRQLNAMMFDIDCHDDDFEENVPIAIRALRDAVAAGKLPFPTMLVDTGRGVQVYYVMERSTSMRRSDGTFNEAGISFFKDIEAGLAGTIRALLDGMEGVQFDPSSLDFARVGRLPGTFNERAGRMCTIVDVGPYHTLSSLRGYCTSLPSPCKETRRRDKTGMCPGFLIERMRGVERLQGHRGFDCRGSRENMCFVYYNTATQVYGPSRALDLTRRFNDRFHYPLPPGDIEQIARTVDGVTILYGRHRGERGYYPLSARSVMDKLFMTDEEARACSFFGTKRQRDRARESNRKKDAREKRNERIVRLYKMGNTLDQVACIVGCSRRTIASVLSDASVTRADRYTLREKFSQVMEAKGESAETWHPSWLCALSSPCSFPYSCFVRLASPMSPFRLIAETPFFDAPVKPWKFCPFLEGGSCVFPESRASISVTHE